jgi:hypothetical protein
VSTHKTLLASVSARIAGDAPAAAPAGSAGAAPGELAAGGTGGGFQRYNAEHRQLLVCFLMHIADLCNPLLPPPVSRRIAADLSREFSRQAELERAAGLPVTVMLAHDDAGRAKLEIGFIGALSDAAGCATSYLRTLLTRVCTHAAYVVRPLYELLAQISPSLGTRCLGLVRLDANVAAWGAVIADAKRASLDAACE